MSFDLKIRQSYHGNGGKEGYRFKVYDSNEKKFGELKNVPVQCDVGDIVQIGSEMYIVDRTYDSIKPREQRSEVFYYELKLYNVEPDIDLGDLLSSNIKTKSN